jgi:hypothetical protein
MSTNKDKPFPSNPEIVTFRYRGPNRRAASADDGHRDQPSGTVRFDDLGNPVWEVRVDIPRRRDGDDTIDLLKCLDNSLLSLEEDEPGK